MLALLAQPARMATIPRRIPTGMAFPGLL